MNRVILDVEVTDKKDTSLGDLLIQRGNMYDPLLEGLSFSNSDYVLDHSYNVSLKSGECRFRKLLGVLVVLMKSPANVMWSQCLVNGGIDVSSLTS